MSDFVQLVLVSLFGVLIGNYLGDSATVRDCINEGNAQMMSGVTIVCDVKRGMK